MHANEAARVAPADTDRSGEGMWLYDFDGRRYLDAISSWWVNLFGHGHPHIKARINSQLDQLEHVILAGFTHAPVVELSERLAALVPGNLGHCFYASRRRVGDRSGAQDEFSLLAQCRRAGEDALRQPRAQLSWRDPRAHCPSPTSHSFGTRMHHCCAPRISCRRRIVASRAAEYPLTITPSPAQRFWSIACSNTTRDRCAYRRAARAMRCGHGMYHPEFLQRARSLCDRYSVHLIADEIAVGFGRTGTLFACEQAGIAPDFLCLSKGHHRRLPAAFRGDDDGRDLRHVLRRRACARLSCIPTRTPAIRSRAARRSRHSTSSSVTT